MPATSPASAASPVQKGSAPPVRPREAEAAPPSALPGASAPPVVNPTVRFDLKLGIVVVEFFDDAGEVANSIPSPQKLKAYAAVMTNGPGQAPAAALPAPQKDPSAGTGEPRAGAEGLAVVA